MTNIIIGFKKKERGQDSKRKDEEKNELEKK